MASTALPFRPPPPPPTPPPSPPPPRPPRYSVTQLDPYEEPYASAPSGPVRGRIIIDEREQALATGHAYSAVRQADGSMAFFSDASCSREYNVHGEGYTSAAFVHKLRAGDEKWIGQGFALPDEVRDINNAELWAVALLLEFIVKCVLLPAGEYAKILLFRIFVDNRWVLDLLASCCEPEASCWEGVDAEALRRARYYDAALTELLDKAVEYRWVPAHSGVEGNEEADRLAGAFRLDILMPQKYTLPPVQVVRAALARFRPYKKLRALTKRLRRVDAAIALSTSHEQKLNHMGKQREVEVQIREVWEQIAEESR